MLRWKLKRGIKTSTDTELQREDKKGCKIKAEWRRLGSRKRVGADRKGREDVRCEDATETLLHTDALTQKRFYTQTPTPLHRDTFDTHTFLRIHFHTDTFTNRQWRIYTQTLLNTKAFTHRQFYTQLLYTQKLWHTDAFTQYTFTHIHFYTQKLLHKSFYTQNSLHTDIHKHFCTKILL